MIKRVFREPTRGEMAILYAVIIVVALVFIVLSLTQCSSDPRDVPVFGPSNLNTQCSTGIGKVVQTDEGWFVECPPEKHKH